MSKPSLAPGQETNEPKNNIAKSLANISETCVTIQEEHEAKKNAIEQEIDERTSTMLQENIQAMELLRFATQCKVRTPSNHQRIGNALGLGQEQISQLRQEGAVVVDVVRIYTKSRGDMLHHVIAVLQEIQAKHEDIIQYCNLILHHNGSDHEKKLRLHDFMKLSQEILRTKHNHYKQLKTLFHKKIGHHAVQKTINGLSH